MLSSHRWMRLSALIAVIQFLGCTEAVPRGDSTSLAEPREPRGDDAIPEPPKETETVSPADSEANDDDGRLGIRLNELVAKIRAIETGDDTVHLDNADSLEIPQSLEPAHRMSLTVLRDFSRALSQRDYNSVVRITLSDKGEPFGFLVVYIAIDRGEFDDAARVMVSDLVRNAENRSYRTWKWSEVNFGERKDFKVLSRQLIDALLGRFEEGSDAERSAIADAFGKGETEAKMGLPEFKEAIGYKARPRDDE